jgi:hypothetical protein
MPWIRDRLATKDIAHSKNDMPASHRLQSPCHTPGGFPIGRRLISTRPKSGSSTEPEIRQLGAKSQMEVSGRMFNGHACQALV